MKILFLTHPYPNYVPDLLLHGLRKLFGPSVVDYPRKDCLYEGILGLGICPEDQRCRGWFPDDGNGVDREDLPRKLSVGFFDLVVADCRVAPWNHPVLSNGRLRLAIIDGEDKPHPIPMGRWIVCRRETDGSDFSIPLPMALPEEILHWICRYDGIEKKYTIGFLGSTHDGERKRLVEQLASRYDRSLFQATTVPSHDNPIPMGRTGRDAYYQNLQQCRVVLTLAGAGFDTFRFWENAACNAVHFSPRFPLYIPDDFQQGDHIIRFADQKELMCQLDKVLDRWDRHQPIIGEGRHLLIQKHLTTNRAEYFLDRVARVFNP